MLIHDRFIWFWAKGIHILSADVIPVRAFTTQSIVRATPHYSSPASQVSRRPRCWELVEHVEGILTLLLA
jgi:hypothetical protein